MAQKNRISIALLVESLFDFYGNSIWKGAGCMAKTLDIDLYTFPGGHLHGTPPSKSASLYESFYHFYQQRNQIYNLVAPDVIDGVIITSSSIGGLVNEELITSFYNRFAPLPRVSIGFPVKGSPSILFDNDRGMRTLINHFVDDHNFKHIAFICGPETNFDARCRLATYKKALEEKGIPPDPALIVPGDFFEESGISAVSMLIDERNCNFDAIIAANDFMAAAAVKELNLRGIDVPGDIAIAGFDNFVTSSYVLPSLTSINQPTLMIGREAVSNIAAQLDGREVDEITIIPSQLILRESCSCGRAANRASVLKTNSTKTNKKNFPEVIKNIFYYYNLYLPENENTGELIQTISDMFLNIKTSGKLDQSFDKVEKLLLIVKKENPDTYLWREAFKDMSYFYHMNIIEDINDSIIIDLEARMNDLLWKNLFGEFKKEIHDTEHFNIMINRLSYAFMNIHSVESLKEIIAKTFPTIHIPSFYLSVYQNHDYRKSRLTVCFHNNDIATIPEEEAFFDSVNFFPEKYKTHSECKSYVIMSVYSQERQHGFAVFEAGLFEGRIYESFTTMLGGVMEHLKVLDERDEYARSLEKKVKERTISLEKVHKEVEEANIKLRKLDELKNDFIANITHEFRSPLTVILNMSHMSLKYKKDLDEESKKTFGMIHRSSIKLKDTIDRLLDLAKMDAEGVKLKVKKIDVVSFMRSIVEYYNSALMKTNIDITENYPDHGIDDFFTDTEKLEVIINNLISNAIKFINPDQGNIIIGVREKKYTVIISVKDNGIGIAEDKQEIIFKRFKQLKSGENKIYKGSGIGLSFSRQLVNFLKGKIWVESEGKNKGSTFFIELKRGKDVFKVDEIAGSEAVIRRKKVNLEMMKHELNSKLNKKGISTSFNDLNRRGEFDYLKSRILIIDDDSLIRNITLQYLLKNGYKNFITASNGIEGLKAIKRFSPDIIICDFYMDEMNGAGLQEKVSGDVEFKGIPFIFLSAVADRNIIQESKGGGALEFLNKPIDEQELISVINRHSKGYMEEQKRYYNN